jgi:uncharacterized PurR-regulated membrane protein YhhQ (DUF165 family)
VKLSTALKGGCIGLYLTGIVAANLSSAHWGPQASIFNAFFFVALVLATRDYLNDLWGKHRRRNMALLILCGGLVSYAAAELTVVAPSDVVERIALASTAAFVLSETLDWFRYETLVGRAWRERAVISTAFSAPVDSFVFVWLAFGIQWDIIAAQTGAKFFGAFIFVYAIHAYRKRRAVPA